MYNTFTLHCYL